MPDLPDDILHLIAHELRLLHAEERPRNALLSQYAGVSQTWNAIIERHTFKHVNIYSEDHVLSPGDPGHRYLHATTPARFKQMMKRDPGRRRAIVGHISFHASYAYDLHTEEGRSQSGRATNDRHFSRCIHDMWEALEDWDARTDSPLILSLRAFSIQPWVEPDHDDVGEEEAYLYLAGDPLPQLRCVGSFKLNDGDRIWPSSVLQMVGSMTALTNARLVFNDITGDGLRQQYREDLGKSICLTPATCRKFDAEFYDNSRGLDELGAVNPASPDTLCIALRDLSTRLRRLKIQHIRLSPALFWSGADEKQQGDGPVTPSWPHLETIDIVFEGLDSYGRYYADPDAEELEFNANEPPWRPIESITRAIPQPERGLHQLLAAAGKAVRSGMPRLKRLHMEHNGAAPDVELYFHKDRKQEDIFHLSWKTSPPVPLTEEVLNAWGLEMEACEVHEGEHEHMGPYAGLEAVVQRR